jgi:hypothetical protein
MQFSWESRTGIGITLLMLVAAVYRRATTSNSNRQTGIPATTTSAVGKSDLRVPGNNAGANFH